MTFSRRFLLIKKQKQRMSKMLFRKLHFLNDINTMFTASIISKRLNIME